METPFFRRHPFLRDFIQVVFFIICVIIGTILLNAFVFRSFNVMGPSMEPTLSTGDRLLVNRLPITWSNLLNKDYIPERGEVIVFKNPKFDPYRGDEYIVKRTIAFPGERVTVEDGTLTVYNQEHPDGFNPDDDFNGEPMEYTSGEVDNFIVPPRTLYVVGDNRTGDFSFDSRSGLGTIPYHDIIGPVGMRIYPFDGVRFF